MAVSEPEKSEEQKSFNFSPGRLPLFALKKKISKHEYKNIKIKNWFVQIIGPIIHVD
jgi:hypothetical protein